MATWQIVLYTILGLLAAFLAITLIRAAFFTPKKQAYDPLPEEPVDQSRLTQHLSEAIRILRYPIRIRRMWIGRSLSGSICFCGKLTR